MDIQDHITTFLARHPEAFDIYQNLPPSHKKEYIRWIEDAKQEKTKLRRMEKMIAMLLDGGK